MDETIIQWHQVQGNPGLTSLDSRMLSPEGYRTFKSTKIKGESKKQAFPVTIIYDKSYVIYYVNKKIIAPLAITSYNELQKIISECWNVHKQENFR